jgi:glycerophosphoryl diester phosphodiesterase
MTAFALVIVVAAHLAAPDAPPVKLIAHRGGVVDAQHIENNLPAIDEAVRRGYWMLEVDVRASADGRLIVHHDPDFRRFYGNGRQVAEMTADEIKQLRSTPGGLPPLEFADFAAACKGRIRLMLDTKGPDHDEAFFASMLEALRKNNLLDSALVIGTDQSRAVFLDKAKIGVNRQKLTAAIERGEDVARRYFLFAHAAGIDADALDLCRRHGVTVVPSINTFHYPADRHLELAAADIARLKKLGVTHFQIDSVYEKFCTGK